MRINGYPFLDAVESRVGSSISKVHVKTLDQHSRNLFPVVLYSGSGTQQERVPVLSQRIFLVEENGRIKELADEEREINFSFFHRETWFYDGVMPRHVEEELETGDWSMKLRYVVVVRIAMEKKRQTGAVATVYVVPTT